LAKRYYFHWIYQISTAPGDLPKEAVFQHLFMERWPYVQSSHSIVFPSKTNSNPQQTIAGEIAFYLNGSLRWGIEIVVQGDCMGEHISRFAYFSKGATTLLLSVFLETIRIF
jgi:hypothetical protein